ncbi:MAG: glycosyltransferase family 9 protein, partial [Chloroflexota bacterium]
TPLHLAATLSRCRLFVGNDSGVMHVALASGVPVVAIFGLSNHRAWGPYDPDGEMSRVVRVELPCSPCLYRGQGLGLRYGCGDPQCLKQVAPAMVLSAARDLLRATDRLTRPS